jgi:regulator of protease activity HflC (stomatin/prohibitin superfamily)
MTAFLGLSFGCTTVPSGEVGIKKTLGKVDTEELGAGLHFFIPGVTSIDRLEVRVRRADFTGPNVISALTNAGLKVAIELTVFYQLQEAQAAETYVKYGKLWDERLVLPLVRSIARDVGTLFDASAVYQKRGEFQRALDTRIREKVVSEGVEVKEVLIRDISLPDNVVKAIEAKIQAMQDAERMRYVLQKESQEAERKKLEAKGIASAQEIIGGSLNPRYLQWKYIDALHALIGAPNNTVLIMPFSKDLVPLLQIPSNQ